MHMKKHTIMLRNTGASILASLLLAGQGFAQTTDPVGFVVDDGVNPVTTLSQTDLVIDGTSLVGAIGDNAADIAAEAAARAAADAAIVADYQAADADIVAGYLAADAAIVAGYEALLGGDGDVEFDNVLVNETLVIQGETLDPVTDTTDILDPQAPYFLEDGIVADTVAVYTEKTTVDVTTTSYESSGIVGDSSGNLTLYASGGEIGTVAYVTAIRQDIYDETTGALAGTLAGTVDVGGYYDGEGNFVELGELVGGVLDLDALTAEQLAMITLEPQVIPADGGNLQVGGNANVDGALTVGGVNITETLDTHFGLVSQNIADIAAEAAARAAADAAIVADYQAADEAIVAGYQAADAAIVAGYEAADEDLAAAIAAGDAAEAAARAAADEDLADAIDDVNVTLGVHYGLVSKNMYDIAQNRKMIDTNTRGIAMVAALTHTTILPGMKNALDISAAYFEGETGVAISYSRRINENTQINFAAASTTDFKESVVRGGIGWQW